MPDEMADAQARVGRVLNDKWTIERLLGLGGMAAVYAARHRNGARAAVKILHAELADQAAVRERFVREGYAANRVEHRGVVRVLDDDVVHGGPDDGSAYLVMELLEGEALEERVARPPPFTEADFLSIADAVLEVLEAAHGHGVVHRDLKPANIFLAREESGATSVKILDFGLARLAESELKTQFGLALGTPSYMSPEQAAGLTDDIDGRTDIFALGATGFRLLARRPIHEAEGMALLIAMAHEPARPIRDVAPGVSERVAAIIDRAIAFRREDRYPTAAAMRADVRAAMAADALPVPEPPEPPARPEPPSNRSVTSVLPALPIDGRWTLPLVLGVIAVLGFVLWALHSAHFEETEPDLPDAQAEPVDAGPRPHAAPPRPTPRLPASGPRRTPAPHPSR